MPRTHTYSIQWQQADRDDENDRFVVKTGQVMCIAEESGCSGDGYTNFSLGEPGEDFIDYDDLSEADVLGFVSEDDKAAARADADTNLDLALAASTGQCRTDLPWGTAQE